MTPKQRAVAIRALITKAGIAPRDVSVRSDRNSLDITIKNLSVGYEKIYDICKEFERVHTDGFEILAGGNIFVSVSHDWKMIADFCDIVEKEIRSEVMTKGFVVWQGIEIGKNDARFQVVANGHSIDKHRCWTFNEAVECAVRELLKTGIPSKEG